MLIIIISSSTVYPYFKIFHRLVFCDLIIGNFWAQFCIIGRIQCESAWLQNCTLQLDSKGERAAEFWYLRRPQRRRRYPCSFLARRCAVFSFEFAPVPLRHLFSRNATGAAAQFARTCPPLLDILPPLVLTIFK